MADLMPLELWAMTFASLDSIDLHRCMRVSKFFQELTQDPKLHSALFCGTVVSTLTSYYKFLITMYLPESEVLYPPRGGWPNISSFGKTDNVMEILRHIPYVQEHSSRDECAQIFDYTVAVDFRSEKPYMAEPIPEIADLPPCAFMLAQPPESDGQYIFLDTEQETVTVYGAPAGWSCFGAGGTAWKVPDGPNQAWRDLMNDEPTYTVPFLFEKFKEEFLNLVAKPVENHCKVLSDNLGTGDDEPKKIFRKHGWPSSDYNKSACMAELSAYAAERSAIAMLQHEKAVAEQASSSWKSRLAARKP